LFLSRLEKYGKGDWKSIARVVKTKTRAQIASHAQKYYMHLVWDKKDKKRNIHDLTL